MGRTLEEFAGEVTDFMPKYMREASRRLFSGGASFEEITMPQMMILNFLSAAGRSKMSDLAKALSVTTSAATGIVDRMVRANLIKRILSEEDRRIIYVELTQKSKKIVDDFREMRYKFVKDVFGKFDSAERERFLDTMKKIYSILKEGAEVNR